MSQLGRIGGQVLTDNLLRAGVDLAFETDLLYLDVNNNRIGVRDSTPIYDLDINSNIRTNDLSVTTQAALGNFRINSPNTITTSVGGIDVYINSGGQLFHDRVTTNNLIFDNNQISSLSNSNIVIDPNGSGTVELRANTDIIGNVAVSGNISMGGNLSTLGTLIVGDSPIDTVTISPDFTQSIIPGDDATYAIGADAGDSTQRRWAQIHAAQWQNITNGTWAGSGIVSPVVTVSDQITLDGTINKIFAIQSNEDVFLNPYTGITRIENISWQANNITNLLNSSLTLSSTNNGYYLFADSNAMVVPAGTNLERRVSPEIGETRWNIDLDYLECYDGSVWAVSTGGGINVSVVIMEDLGHAYTLMLG
jgi:hypothetical protein